MSKDIVATSKNIENITSMLTKLENIKDDSSKLREISLDNTGWEGMDATAFNSSLNNFTQKLDKTSTDIEQALLTYKSKQIEQLENAETNVNIAYNLTDAEYSEYKKNPNKPYSPELIEAAQKRIVKESLENIKNSNYWNNIKPASENDKNTSTENSSSGSIAEYEQKQQNELKDMLKTYYDNKKSSLSISNDVNVEGALKNKLRDDMNKSPGNNITDKQINDIINKYGTDGFSEDEVKQIWDEYYTKG